MTRGLLAPAAILVIAAIGTPFVVQSCVMGERIGPSMTIENDTDGAYDLRARVGSNEWGLATLTERGHVGVLAPSGIPQNGCRDDYTLILVDPSTGARVATSTGPVCGGDTWRIVQRGSDAASRLLLSPRQSDPPS